MKLFRRILIFAGVLVALFLALNGLYAYKMKSETSKMHPSETKEIVEGIYAVKDDTFINMYLIKSGSNYVAVDAAKSINNVRQEMEKHNISPESVTAVLLTHTDSDHIGAVKLFKNAEVYISTAEEQMINGKTARAAAVMKNKLEGAYEIIEDNQTVNISGLKVKGILTPGHTPGSMSYIINDKYLFTGDTMGLKDGKAGVFNKFFNMDSAMQEKSITKLAALTGIEYIFTAHHGYTDNFKKAFESRESK